MQYIYIYLHAVYNYIYIHLLIYLHYTVSPLYDTIFILQDGAPVR